MKTIQDRFNELIPTIVKEFEDTDHEIGDKDNRRGFDGSNKFIYEDDNFSVTVCYTIMGTWSYDRGDRWTPPSYDIIEAHGEVDFIEVYYKDDKDFEIEIDEKELEKELNEYLKDMA